MGLSQIKCDFCLCIVVKYVGLEWHGPVPNPEALSDEMQSPPQDDSVCFLKKEEYEQIFNEPFVKNIKNDIAFQMDINDKNMPGKK